MPASRPSRRTAGRLVAIEVDMESLPAGGLHEREREVAISDLLADNSFLAEGKAGRFRLRLSVVERKLVLEIADQRSLPLAKHVLALSPLNRIIRDYRLICESHREALHGAPAARVEAIDMGRRGLHDEGAEMLRERLSPRIEVDFPTARRLFTLVSALAWKG
jgi:uncharacterized protein (UPF0262 family)